MAKPVIEVESLSKLYRLGATVGHDTLRDRIADGARSLLGMGGVRASKESDDLWALKDVSFGVQEGEVIGIIGRNGAGKSTLLKILSRITDPTSGTARIRGRVASLLEVGTGFHPELTGRENIYLNGAILGMRRDEIKARFDEIVAFAEVERFLDTPVKRYSSGMYVRLAFAVAAHIDPEVLIVDEVLAVGDAAFQKKCLGKMQDVSQGGRTVLFVSHNMGAVENLCRQVVLLENGGIAFMGGTSEAINRYLSDTCEGGESLLGRKDRAGIGGVRVSGINFSDDGGNRLSLMSSGQAVNVHIAYEAEPGKRHSDVVASLLVRTQMGVPVFLQHNRLTGDEFGAIPEKGAFVCRIARLPLPPSRYILSYSVIENGATLDAMGNCVTMEVVEGDYFGSGEVPPSSHGFCLVDAGWRIEPAPCKPGGAPCLF